MKLAVVGGRDFKDYEMLAFVLDRDFGGRITEIVTGGALGADALGDRYSLERLGKPATKFEAAWNNVTAPGAIVKVNSRGERYNANAGFERNHYVASYSDEMAAFWDGISHGTQDVVGIMKAARKPTKVYRYD